MCIHYQHTNRKQTMNTAQQNRAASHLIAMGVPMLRKMTGEWLPVTVRVSGPVCKINGKVVRASVLAQAQTAGLTA